VALLFSVYPEVKQKLDKIVILGGAMGLGNISPAAEFNILIDPEAAKIVFEAGVPFVMVPLEVSYIFTDYIGDFNDNTVATDDHRLIQCCH
jgi:pyrimidine-specific ribonucleoside hydrolase